MPSRLNWVCVAVLVVSATACASMTTPTVNPTPTGGSTSTVTAIAALVARPSVITTPAALTPALAPGASLTPSVPLTQTIALSPTATPIPGPPTATLTPAPDQATASSAQDVDQALVAFADAQAKGDAQASLQTQRALLVAVSKAAATASADQSPYGQQLRAALDAVQGGAGGNYDQLQNAHKLLVQIGGAVQIGGTITTPVVSIPRPAAQTQQSLPDLAKNLKGAVDAYVQASSSGNSNDLLRAQRDLIAATDATDAATKSNHSPYAQQLAAALTTVHDALGGDAGKFQDASNSLANLTSPNALITPSATATTLPTATPTVLPTATATLTGSTAKHVDLQPLQNDVDNKLQTLQSQVAGTDKAAIQTAETQLQQSIQKALDATADDHSPAASHFRDALGTAGNAAAGDQTKIQTARDQLKAAMGQ